MDDISLSLSHHRPSRNTMEESGGRPRYPKQGGRERVAVATEPEAWRNQDAGRGYSPKPERGGHGGFYRASPKKGGMGPLSSSPRGVVFKGGKSPSQREGFQRPRYQNTLIPKTEHFP